MRDRLRIELRLDDFSRPTTPQALDEAVERLLPVALERLGEALADRQWESFYRQLRDAGVRPPQRSEPKADFVRRHAERYAARADHKQRELVRQRLRNALERLPES